MLSVDEINLLHGQNEGLKEQNKTLQTAIMLYAKQINTINDICNEPADNIAVVELQNRIKDVINDKNN